jgi:hypothetical protein
MPLLGFTIYERQELLPGLWIPLRPVFVAFFVVELLDLIVNHAINHVTQKGTNPINPSPCKINSPPILGADRKVRGPRLPPQYR